MSRWTCPACDRVFGRAGQSHVCLPGNSVEESFRGQPPEYRLIYDAIAGHLATLGPVHVDAVEVGVFLRRERKLAEIRPKARSLRLTIYLPHVIDHPRIARSIGLGSSRVVNEVKLTSVADVDDLVKDWLTEAWLESGD